MRRDVLVGGGQITAQALIHLGDVTPFSQDSGIHIFHLKD